MTTNIRFHRGSVTAAQRAGLLRQQPCVIWLTGLSGSGKSTIAYELESSLVENGHAAYVLDGDNLRHGLNAGLGFSVSDRDENVRRAGEAAALLADAGLIVITSLISPLRAQRDRARQSVGEGRFLEVYVDVPLDVCESRDPKGLYRKARAGEIPEFTGISSPYEPPLSPEVTLKAADLPVAACVDQILAALRQRGHVHPSNPVESN